MHNIYLKLFICVSVPALLLSSCGLPVRDGEPDSPLALGRIHDAVPRDEPLSKSGNAPSYVVKGKRYFTLASSHGFVQQGIASWYGTRFHGNKTANGETYDMYQMTAAHKTLPLPSFVTVKNLDNGRQITVRVNDRGPFVDGRIIDLSYAAALKLGIRGSGTAHVEVRDARAPQGNGIISRERGKPLYFLQLGAFKDPNNASRLRRRVAEVTAADVQISQVELDDGTLHRVRIGPFKAQSKAHQLSTQLIQQGVISQSLLIVQ